MIKNITIKQALPWAITAVAVVLVLLFIFRKVPLPGPDPLQEYLKKQNDSLMNEQIKGNEAEKIRMREVDSLLTVIDSIDSKVDVIKKYYETKVFIYDTFSIDQLEQYFTDRYR